MEMSWVEGNVGWTSEVNPILRTRLSRLWVESP